MERIASIWLALVVVSCEGEPRRIAPGERDGPTPSRAPATAPVLLAPGPWQVAGPRPTFRWTGDERTAVVLELCRDSRCDGVLSSHDVRGTSFQPSTDLSPGSLFWRVRAGRRASGIRPLEVWPNAPLGEITVGPAPAPPAHPLPSCDERRPPWFTDEFGTSSLLEIGAPFPGVPPRRVRFSRGEPAAVARLLRCRPPPAEREAREIDLLYGCSVLEVVANEKRWLFTVGELPLEHPRLRVLHRPGGEQGLLVTGELYSGVHDWPAGALLVESGPAGPTVAWKGYPAMCGVVPTTDMGPPYVYEGCNPRPSFRYLDADHDGDDDLEVFGLVDLGDAAPQRHVYQRDPSGRLESPGWQNPPPWFCPVLPE